MRLRRLERTGKSASQAAGQVVGVVDIGSSAIRLTIAEIQGSGEWKNLDNAERGVALGRDVFDRGFITPKTIKLCLSILIGFKELMADYQVDHICAIGTSALREASNREIFCDRTRIQTGIEIEIIEGVDANYLTYMAVRHALLDFSPPLTQTSALIMEVGGGSTELLILENGRMQTSHTMNIGTVRLQQKLHTAMSRSRYPRRLLLKDVQRNLDVLQAEQPLNGIHRFIAVGGDARLVAARVGEQVHPRYRLIRKAAFHQFIDQLAGRSVDEVVQLLTIPYNDAENIFPALLVYRVFFDATPATEVIVPYVSIRDGILLNLSQGVDNAYRMEFHRQVIASAFSLAKKYQYESQHAEKVNKAALALFDQLMDSHGLGEQERILLETAAILHDIGTFISPSAHHKHGQYIIEHSDLFGLSGDDLRIVANVVRYHRRRLPATSHSSFMAMSREDRNIVLKLAAILRVADALDRSHSHRARTFSFEPGEEELVIRCDSPGDVSLEKMSLEEKADLFEQVFGLHVVLAAHHLGM